MEEEIVGKTKDLPKYMKEYFEKPEVKENGRKASRESMRRKRHPLENRIEDVGKIIENMKNYPANFPVGEFNNKLDEILEYNHSELEEKTLQDLLYNILDKKGILTPERMIIIYNSLKWEKAIEGIMNERKYLLEEKTIGLSKIRVYSKNGDEKYIPIQK